MKKILFASTALVATAGIAAADVTFSGDAGFGLLYNSNAAPGTTLTPSFNASIAVELRAETDNGLAFGGDFSITASASTIGGATVFVEGGFGRFEVGGVDNAIQAVVGGLADPGWAGAGVDNYGEALRNMSVANALYTGTFGDFSVALSGDLVPAGLGGSGDWAVAAGYTFGDYNVAAGYDQVAAGGYNAYHIGAGATFGDFGVNGLYSGTTGLIANIQTYGLDASYTMGAVKVTAAFGAITQAGLTASGVALGVDYDLGGGATVQAGIANFNANAMGPLFGGPLTFGAAGAGVAGGTMASIGIDMAF